MSHLQSHLPSKPAFHRCSDSLENFILKFQIREIKNLIFSTDSMNGGFKSSKDDGPFICNTNIKWQEKIYSPLEIHNYIKYKTDKCPDSFREKKKIMQSYESKHGIKFEDLLKPTMLYTYVDNDDYVAEVPPTVMGGDGSVTTDVAYLSGNARSPEASGSVALSALSNARKYNNRHHKENGIKKMYVCIATNVEVEKMKSTSLLEPRLFFDEYLLCQVDVLDTSTSNKSVGQGDWEADGIANELLVVMTPNVSPLLPENSSSPGLLAATLDDASSYSAIKQGLRLENYRVSCRGGCEFLYTIENLNQKISPLDIASLEQNTRLVEKMAVLTNRGLEDFIETKKGANDDSNPLANLWKQDPPKSGYDKSINYMAEIVSADGFDEEDGIFIEYFFSYSDGYSLRTGNRSDGVDNNRKRDNPLHVQEEFDAESVGLMRGQTMISYSKSNNSSRHGLKLPRLRPTWDGVVFTSEIPQVSREIIGYSFYVVTFLILLFDFGYPFFLFVAITLLYYCMTASPNTALQMVIADDKIDNSNSGGSFGQAAGRSFSRSNMKVVGDMMTDTTFNINHPISASFDAKEQSNNDNFVSGQGPIIFFQVFGLGYVGTQTLIGYGYTQLPQTSGYLDVSVNTWKPIGDSTSRMSEFYLGTSTKLRHPNFIHHSKNSKVINKFGVTTETSGRIRFRCQIITSTLTSSIMASVPTSLAKADSQADTKQDMAKSSSKGSLRNLRASGSDITSSTKSRDVDDILKEMNVSMSGTFKAGLSSSTSSSAKIDDILAKAKAKRQSKDSSHK